MRTEKDPAEAGSFEEFEYRLNKDRREVKVVKVAND
jgi:hypothetical protein